MAWFIFVKLQVQGPNLELTLLSHSNKNKNNKNNKKKNPHQNLSEGGVLCRSLKFDTGTTNGLTGVWHDRPSLVILNNMSPYITRLISIGSKSSKVVVIVIVVFVTKESQPKQISSKKIWECLGQKSKNIWVQKSFCPKTIWVKKKFRPKKCRSTIIWSQKFGQNRVSNSWDITAKYLVPIVWSNRVSNRDFVISLNRLFRFLWLRKLWVLK